MTICGFLFHLDITFSHRPENLKYRKILQLSVSGVFRSWDNVFEIYLNGTVVKTDRNRTVCKVLPPYIDLVSICGALSCKEV